MKSTSKSPTRSLDQREKEEGDERYFARVQKMSIRELSLKKYINRITRSIVSRSVRLLSR